MICGFLRAAGIFDRLCRQRTAQMVAIITAFISLIAGTYCNQIWPGWFLPSIVSSCLLVFGVYASTGLSRFFAMPFSRWLGRISFPLYLMHFPVIASFTSGLVVLAHAHDALGPVTIWLIVFGSASLSLLFAVLFLPVEALTVRIGDLTYQAVMR
jgi:peptidoglycan/LPS O-acetylase OafA/YrhL